MTAASEDASTSGALPALTAVRSRAGGRGRRHTVLLLVRGCDVGEAPHELGLLARRRPKPLPEVGDGVRLEGEPVGEGKDAPDELICLLCIEHGGCNGGCNRGAAAKAPRREEGLLCRHFNSISARAKGGLVTCTAHPRRAHPCGSQMRPAVWLRSRYLFCAASRRARLLFACLGPSYATLHLAGRWRTLRLHRRRADTHGPPAWRLAG